MTRCTVGEGQGNVNLTYLRTAAHARFDPKWPLSSAGTKSPLSHIFFHFGPKENTKRYSTAMLEAQWKRGDIQQLWCLVTPQLPPELRDPQPSQKRPQPHHTCWGLEAGLATATSCRGKGPKGRDTKWENVWCHFPQGIRKDSSNPGRSPGARVKEGRAIYTGGAPEVNQPPPRFPQGREPCLCLEG